MKVLKKMKRTLLVGLIGIVSMALAACGGQSEDTVVVAGKNFTEQDILAHMIASLIEEKTDLKVERKTFLGGTQVVHNAMVSGDVDIYAEYTGTAWTATLGQDVIADPQETYDNVKAAYVDEYNLTWLEPLGFNNTYALSMRAEHAEKLGIETVSDLAEYAQDFTLGSTHEFLERPDGYIGLAEVYGLQFAQTKGMDPGLTYSAVREGAADVNDAFSTDGRIVALNLKTLEDDKNFFPPYYAAPVVRTEVLEAHPELEEVLNLLGGKLTDVKMSELNAEVDLNDRRPQDVAEEWLKEVGLME